MIESGNIYEERMVNFIFIFSLFFVLELPPLLHTHKKKSEFALYILFSFPVLVISSDDSGDLL